MSTGSEDSSAYATTVGIWPANLMCLLERIGVNVLSILDDLTFASAKFDLTLAISASWCSESQQLSVTTSV